MRMNILIALLLLCAIPMQVEATVVQTGKDTTGRNSKLTEYEKLFKDKKTKTISGFLTLHKVDDKLLVEVPLKEMDTDLMLVSIVSQISDHTDCHPGVSPMVPVKVSFSKLNNVVNLTRDKSILYAEKGSNIEDAVKKNAIGAVLKSFKIKAYNNDSTAVVIDMTDFFIGDEKLLSPIHAKSESKLMMRGIKFNHYKDGCYLNDVKSFKNNVCITSTLTYTSKVNQYTRYTTAEVDRMFVKLPTDVMAKRDADFRLPVQTIGRLIYKEGYNASDEYYYALRWRLEPKDEKAFRSGKGSEVKKPIIFYIDTTFSSVVKEAIIAGVGEWNKPFEAMGFKNVIQFRDFPKNDDSFDPDNFDYNVIRYIPSLVGDVSVRTYADPRSGEILRTNINICHNYVHDIPYERFLHTAHADPSVRQRYLPDHILKEEIKYHIMWVAGIDCFGMSFNLTSSAAFNVDSLRTASFTQKYGTSPSALDLASHNKVAPIDGALKGIRLTPVGTGEYDNYIVNWLYRPFYEGEDEKAILKKMVDEKVGNPIYRYEYAKNCPDCGSGDVGDDDLKVAAYQMENLEYMFNNFDKWISDKDDPQFQFREGIYKMLHRRYKQILTQVALNIYGVTTYQRKGYDNLPAYEFMPKERQQKAMDMLFAHIQRPQWAFRNDLLTSMEIDRTTEESHKDYFMLLMNTIAGALYAYETAPGDHIRHADFVRMQVEKFWQKTKEGKSLNQFDIYFQNYTFRTLIKSAQLNDVKIKYANEADPKQKELGEIDYKVVDFSTDDKTALVETLSGYLESTDDVDVQSIAGRFGELKKWPVMNVQSTRYAYVDLIKQIKEWTIEQSKNENISLETKQHYKYVIDTINRILF